MFQARNRHNLEQSSKLAQNKELLNKRNAQVTVMDQRIGDLRERLHKKRAEVHDLLPQLLFLPAGPQTFSLTPFCLASSSAEPYERRRPVLAPDSLPSRRGGVGSGRGRLPLHPGPGGETGGRVPDASRPAAQTHTALPHPLPLRLVEPLVIHI